MSFVTWTKTRTIHFFFITLNTCATIIASTITACICFFRLCSLFRWSLLFLAPGFAILQLFWTDTVPVCLLLLLCIRIFLREFTLSLLQVSFERGQLPSHTLVASCFVTLELSIRDTSSLCSQSGHFCCRITALLSFRMHEASAFCLFVICLRFWVLLLPILIASHDIDVVRTKRLILHRRLLLDLFFRLLGFSLSSLLNLPLLILVHRLNLRTVTETSYKGALLLSSPVVRILSLEIVGLEFLESGFTILYQCFALS